MNDIFDFMDLDDKNRSVHMINAERDEFMESHKHLVTTKADDEAKYTSRLWGHDVDDIRTVKA